MWHRGPGPEDVSVARSVLSALHALRQVLAPDPVESLDRPRSRRRGGAVQPLREMAVPVRDGGPQTRRKVVGVLRDLPDVQECQEEVTMIENHSPETHPGRGAYPTPASRDQRSTRTRSAPIRDLVPSTSTT